MDADAAAGLLGGAERYAGHLALHRHAGAEQRREAANVAQQIADGGGGQVGREIIEKFIQSMASYYLIMCVSVVHCNQCTKSCVPKNGQFSVGVVLFAGL